jgi:hypothetical protein
MLAEDKGPENLWNSMGSNKIDILVPVWRFTITIIDPAKRSLILSSKMIH